jgi:hypothetical protein
MAEKASIVPSGEIALSLLQRWLAGMASQLLRRLGGAVSQFPSRVPSFFAFDFDPPDTCCEIKD